jgi:hypothetical protein
MRFLGRKVLKILDPEPFAHSSDPPRLLGVTYYGDSVKGVAATQMLQVRGSHFKTIL